MNAKYGRKISGKILCVLLVLAMVLTGTDFTVFAAGVQTGIETAAAGNPCVGGVKNRRVARCRMRRWTIVEQVAKQEGKIPGK